MIRSSLRSLRPTDGWWGEESGLAPGVSGIQWVVDPIDGTTEYVYDRPGWAVSVAAIREYDRQGLVGVVVEPALRRITEASLGRGTWCDGRRLHCRASTDLGRALVEVNLGAGRQRQRAARLMDELVPQERDVRDCAAAASALAAVAAGRLDAYEGPGLREWDGAAGQLLVNEAGGTTGDLTGSSRGAWPASGDILAADPGIVGAATTPASARLSEPLAVATPSDALGHREARNDGRHHHSAVPGRYAPGTSAQTR